MGVISSDDDNDSDWVVAETLLTNVEDAGTGVDDDVDVVVSATELSSAGGISTLLSISLWSKIDT